MRSESAAYRVLVRAGMIDASLRDRRSRKWKRWERGAPMQLRQMDIVGRFALAEVWHSSGMNRIRLSTTVDAGLLSSARDLRAGITDAALIDEALGALLARHRSAEVDASYAAYDKHPIDEPDEWGDLASWRRAAGAS